MSLCKKMSALKDEISKGNTYFFKETIQNARTLFRFRVELFEAKENFKNKYKKMRDFCVIAVSQKLTKAPMFYTAQAIHHCEKEKV